MAVHRHLPSSRTTATAKPATGSCSDMGTPYSPWRHPEEQSASVASRVHYRRTTDVERATTRVDHPHRRRRPQVRRAGRRGAGPATTTVALRRQIHKHPELGLDLPATQAAVQHALEGLDMQVSTGK